MKPTEKSPSQIAAEREHAALSKSLVDALMVDRNACIRECGRLSDLEWLKNWNALKRRDVRLSQSPAAVSLSQVSPG